MGTKLQTRIARKANEAGQQGMVMSALRKTATTGFRVMDKRVAREVVYGAHLRAVQSGWTIEGIEAGLRQAEILAEMLENAKYAGTTRLARRDLSNAGVLMELAAARALKLGNNDDDERCQLWTERFLALWASRRRPEVTDMGEPECNEMLVYYSPTLHGARMAAKVRPELRERLRSVEEHMEGVLESCRKVLDGELGEKKVERRGWKAFEGLVADGKTVL